MQLEFGPINDTHMEDAICETHDYPYLGLEKIEGSGKGCARVAQCPRGTRLDLVKKHDSVTGRKTGSFSCCEFRSRMPPEQSIHKLILPRTQLYTHINTHSYLVGCCV